MLHGFNFSKLVSLSTLVFTHTMPVILTSFNIRDLYTLGVRRTPNQTDRDMTFSRSCDPGKSKKRIERQWWTFDWFFEPNFKIVLFQLAWFSWLFDTSL